ncbi:hypothetical protein SteCoe_13412 [Stentor coeruleus]|uniref:Uncharacterized protein n=1 Tax=Stentor coeruleus TaxID=5963 RepID=A0A1R2C8P2_9CILI|nr:hypothetical protein SteCoe_13412 [Stentor coeruleus]
MELGKRQTRSTFTPQSNKKLKLDSSVTVTRVYYEASFDMFNFTDTMFLKQITQNFRNCYLIVGIDDESPNPVMTLQERERALKQCPYVRQILCPAPNVEYAFLKSFEIEYVISTPETSKRYAELDLGEGLFITEPNVKLTSNDLIARVVSSKEKLLIRCLNSGFNRKQLDVSLLKEIKIRLFSFLIPEKWPNIHFRVFKDLSSIGKSFFRILADRIEAFDNSMRMIADELQEDDDMQFY